MNEKLIKNGLLPNQSMKLVTLRHIGLAGIKSYFNVNEIIPIPKCVFFLQNHTARFKTLWASNADFAIL